VTALIEEVEARKATRGQQGGAGQVGSRVQRMAVFRCASCMAESDSGRRQGSVCARLTRMCVCVCFPCAVCGCRPRAAPPSRTPPERSSRAARARHRCVPVPDDALLNVDLCVLVCWCGRLDSLLWREG
jgi:hypothetical protein